MKKYSPNSPLANVKIARPCSEDWDKMYGNEEVRFCSHCAKNVHNLSEMTRKKARRLLARSGGNLCVRYLPRPDGTVMTATDRLHQISGRVSRLAAGVFGATMSLTAAAWAQGGVGAAKVSECESKPPADSQIRSGKAKPQKVKQTGFPGQISGTITDQTGAVIAGAAVTLTNQQTSEQRAANTNDTGVYFFYDVPEAIYSLKIEASGFERNILENLKIRGGIESKFDSILDGGYMMGAVAITISHENQLIRAVDEGDLERFKQLIAAGVGLNDKDNNSGDTALNTAVGKGNLETIRLLLDMGAKVNLRDGVGRTALMKIDPEEYEYAIEREDKAAEEAREATEAAPESVPESATDAETDEVANPAQNATEAVPPTDRQNTGTPADEEEPEVDEEAVMADRVKERVLAVANLLLGHGAKVNLKDEDGRTALMHAAGQGVPELLRLLISHKAQLNIQAKNGRTALMEAADEDETENVRVLLEAGAITNLKDKEGETAFSLTGNKEIQDLLIQYGFVPPLRF